MAKQTASPPTITPPTGVPPTPPAITVPQVPTGNQVANTTMIEPIKLSPQMGKREGSARIGIYGPPSVGKTTAAAWLPSPLFFDLEHGTEEFEAVPREICGNWRELRGKLAGFMADPVPGIRSIVVDGATKAQAFATDFTLETRRQRGAQLSSLSAFAYGNGWGFVFTEMLSLFADLDRIAERGYNVCMIAHVVMSEAPHASDVNYPRWEPSLYPGSSKGNHPIRGEYINWCTHLAFIDYDVSVDKATGKAVGVGTRSLHTLQTASHIAKSRSKQLTSFPYTPDNPGAVWAELGIK